MKKITSIALVLAMLFSAMLGLKPNNPAPCVQSEVPDAECIGDFYFCFYFEF